MYKFVSQHYENFNSSVHQEQIILSDLTSKMYDDIIVFFNTNHIEKATNITLALASWISADINYILKISASKIKLYEYDLLATLKLLGQLIGICEDFKQWNTAYTLQKEYAKLNIRYSLSQAA